MSGITKHAHERALERYGFAPTKEEARQMLEDCSSGVAPCLRKNKMGLIHVVKVRGKLMVIAVALDAPVIVTVLDRSYFNAGSRLAHHKKAYAAKQRSAVGPTPAKPDYKRGRWKAEARNAGEGE